MQLVDREYDSDKTVHGFNGQLRDKNIQKDHHTALFWEYDPRIGRRWNIDPVDDESTSPYAVLAENPIMNVDPLGDDWYKSGNGDVMYKNNWHGKHKGYEYLGKGNGDVLTYNGKEYNRKTGEITRILEGVVVTTKPKPNIIQILQKVEENQDLSEAENSLYTKYKEAEAKLRLTIVEKTNPLERAWYGVNVAGWNIWGERLYFCSYCKELTGSEYSLFGKMITGTPPDVGVGKVGNVVKVGNTIGKLGTIVENPSIKLTGYTAYSLMRKIVRGVSSKAILNTIRNPKIVFSQGASGGRFLFLSEDAAVVLNSSGKVITTYSKDHFDHVIKAVLESIK
jgi:RHS repeat-associated protein